MKPDFDYLQKKQEMMILGTILWSAIFVVLGIIALVAYVIIN